MLHLFLLILCWARPAAASNPQPGGSGDYALFGKKDQEASKGETTEEQKAEDEAERKRKETLARVIVLKWPETSADHRDSGVMRNVKSRIARPEAMFFPEVDLYQSGRKLPDKTVIPAMQPAVVPDNNIPAVLAATNRAAAIPWDAKQPAEWGILAQDLRALAEQLWFVDRVALREPLFLLYAQIGRAAENQNYPAPPFYVEIGTQHLNTYFYYAALLAYQEPALMSRITDQDTNASIQYLLDQLQQGRYPTFKLDFMLENQFESEDFEKEYELFINGLPVEVDSKGQIDAFLGRTDIYLKRKDSGHGLSERLELTIRDEKIYFVRDAARKLMGDQFIDQLFDHKEECYPELSGDILNYLAIYAKLHDKADIYIAVPENGNPNKTWIWRYDRERAMLSKVGGGGDTFPIRFVLMTSSGALFNGAAPTLDPTVDPAQGPSGWIASEQARKAEGINAALVPLNIELRGHYNRLLVNAGLEFGWNQSEDFFREAYRTPQHKGSVSNVVVVDPADPLDDNGEPIEIYHQTEWNRYTYFGLGVVLGRDAALGFGPRFALRSGWTNLPHAWQTTGHFGWSIQPPFPDFRRERVRPVLDADFRGGISMPLNDSVYKDLTGFSRIQPVFGLTAGMGITF